MTTGCKTARGAAAPSRARRLRDRTGPCPPGARPRRTGEWARREPWPRGPPARFGPAGPAPPRLPPASPPAAPGSRPSMGRSAARASATPAGQALPGQRLGQREGAGAGAAQGREVGAGAQLLAQVVGQRAHVEAGRDPERQGGAALRRSPSGTSSCTVTSTGAGTHGRGAPGVAVGGLAGDLLGRVGRRGLEEPAGEGRERRLQRLALRAAGRSRGRWRPGRRRCR